MFLKFDSQKERSQYGGTCFIELQFCKCPEGTDLKTILSDYNFWLDDSLYVYGDDPFYAVYGPVFGNGIHPDMTKSYPDPWGVTYYRADQIDDIIERAEKKKPLGYKILTEWLNEAKEYNGIIIHGM